MMMLPSIMDVAALAMSAFSPSKTCKVRVSSTRYRNDPYRARVLPRQFATIPTPVYRVREAPVAPIVQAPFVQVPKMMVAPVAPLVSAAAPIVAATAPPSPVKAVAVPVATTETSKPQQHFALIGFKHETMMFQAPFRVAVGDVVVVEADRGEHVGVVQSITTTAPKYNVPCRLLRRGTHADVAAYEALKVKEAATTKSVQKLSESLGLGIKIVDTEFQLDNNKLTVFFSSKVFVDFRKLQRSLFRDYRCRIWLVNWAEVRPYTSVPVNRA